MKRIAKVIVVLLLDVPLASVVTLLTIPFWRWFEASTSIESIGHSGPAIWCYLSVFVTLGVIGTLSWVLAPKEDLLGYGGLGVAIGILMMSHLLGLMLGVIAFWRREQPRLLTLLVLVLNGASLLWVIAKSPIYNNRTSRSKCLTIQRT
jgi:ribose/xylose/arabinose/galactoside ABC-type transport system permease subunit